MNIPGSCVGLGELQMVLIADGDLPADHEIIAELGNLEEHHLIRRCPDHPSNWRITTDGLDMLLSVSHEATA